MDLLRKVVVELFTYADAISSAWPGATGVYLRRWWLHKRFAVCGTDMTLAQHPVITGFKSISIGSRFAANRSLYMHSHNGGSIAIGDDVAVNSNTHINAANGGRIVISDRVIIAQNVVLRASDHAYSEIDIPIRDQGHQGGTIVIEEGAWIGANVVVTRDVTIGRHSIIGAGAVVTRNIPAYSVAGGVPARVLRSRQA